MAITAPTIEQSQGVRRLIDLYALWMQPRSRMFF